MRMLVVLGVSFCLAGWPAACGKRGPLSLPVIGSGQ